MKHPHKLLIGIVAFTGIFLVLGCGSHYGGKQKETVEVNPNTNVDESNMVLPSGKVVSGGRVITSNKGKMLPSGKIITSTTINTDDRMLPSGKIVTSGKMLPSGKKVQYAERMIVSFGFPVVMIDGTRAYKQEFDYLERIEVAYPQNSIHDITLTVQDGDGKEQDIRGRIKVFRYTEYSKGGEGLKPKKVMIDPQDPEYVYNTIIRNGYGVFTVREQIEDPEKGRVKGPVLVQLILGTKKKSDKLEFRIRSDDVHSVNGKTLPVTLEFPENSHHYLAFTVDEGYTKIQGELDVFTHNYYTRLAPVWIQFNDEIMENLRGRGGEAKIALCAPSYAAQQPSNRKDEYTDSILVKSLGPGQKPALLARRYGKLVAFLKLRRVE